MLHFEVLVTPIPRAIAFDVNARLDAFRVIVINGPRQSGKSTLLRQLAGERGGTYLSLDDRLLLDAARQDPGGVLDSVDGPIFLDEFQLGGDDLVRAIKVRVDSDQRPGQFVLAGSTQFLTVPTLSESLAGRASIVDLWPFSVGESQARDETFIDRAFDAMTGAWPTSTLMKKDYLELAALGGFPGVHQLGSERLRRLWFGDYVRTVTQRDIRDISRARMITQLPDLLRVLAARSGTELVISNVAADAGFNPETLRDYLALLETVYLFTPLRAWSRNLSSRVKHRPKVHLVDSGLVAALSGATPLSLLQPTSVLAGGLLETFVVQELRKQTGWSETRPDMFHFRDRSGPEVDVILEAPDGRIVACEVKAGQDAGAGDFRWLEYVRQRAGASFVAGIVLHAGQRMVPFGDRLWAAPISLLWS